MDYDRLRELQQKFDENPRRYFAPLANEYRKGGQPRRAIEICKTQLEQMPGHMSGQIVYGQALFEAGEFAEARKVFERALTLDPENLIALRSLGDMSLQAGNTAEARAWYSRLLDADPKDTSVIALISEIDAASEATPVPAEVPGIDTDVGDQQIPAGVEPAAEEAIPEPALLRTSEMPKFDAPVEERPVVTDDYPPLGLERHYPVPEPSAEQSQAQAQTQTAPSSNVASSSEASGAEGPSLEDLGVPAGNSAAEGLTSARQDVTSALDSRESDIEDSGATPASSGDIEMRVAGLETTQLAEATELPYAAESSEQSMEMAEQPMDTSQQPMDTSQQPMDVSEPDASPELSTQSSGTAPVEPPASDSAAAESTERETESDSEASPPHRAAPAEERPVAAASTEPFVNETMAKLYLKQGYNQLALKVYRQLLVSRPNDQSLRDRIREIQEADAAQHPVEARTERQETDDQRSDETAREPEPPRAPSVESPASEPAPEADDGFSFGTPAPDSSPDYDPRRDREPIETPARDDRRAEAVAPAGRQPSIREFFATLGRRRPPRSSSAAAPRATTQQPVERSADAPQAFGDETSQPFGASPPTATLDSVFAGATVSAADARAASRLAGAFSGAAGASRTPPTPPMPTPRLNPRVQAQESEEDVAKFRAWLDGLTGE